MTVLKADFSDGIILPVDRRMQYIDHAVECPLPKDGLPRITAEGVKILAEGMRGDFSRWRWGIGNHPLEMPREHLRNAIIRAMDDRPHFIASFWTGPTYPQVKCRIFTPNYCFDRIDTLRIEPGGYGSEEEDPLHRMAYGDVIHLCQSADFWAHCPLVVDSAYLWDKGPGTVWEEDGLDDDSGDGCTEECARTPAPSKVATLEAWFGE